MKFKHLELQIKIGSLAEESRLIRRKELSEMDKAFKITADALIKRKGIDPSQGCPVDLQAELDRRIQPLGQRNDHRTAMGKMRQGANVAKKVIRKYFRDGLTREEILALPHVKHSLKHEANVATLHRHRKGLVRHEARHSQLALAFLRERAYSKTEDKPSSYPNWEKVVQIAQRFSAEDKRNLNQKFEQWRQEAQAFIRGRELMGKAYFPREPIAS
jgi:hypothetical protein